MDRQLLITKTRAVSDRQSLLDLLNEVNVDLLGSSEFRKELERIIECQSSRFPKKG